MFSCLQSNSHTESKRKEERKEEPVSFSVSVQLKDTMVRVVHAGGRIEMYHNPIPASKLIQKYPAMCIARPNVFNSPHEALLSADDILLPGHKYFLIRRTSVEKLKHKHSRTGKTNVPTGRDEPILNSREPEDVGDVSFEESICSAKDFFVSKDTWLNFTVKKRVKSKKPFVPPIQRRRQRSSKLLEWEPSLTSIQELSP